MYLENLTPSERFIFGWQYCMLGNFKTALINAIKEADDCNLARLQLGFPDEVDGYIEFTRTDGWWQAVQKKAGMLK